MRPERPKIRMSPRPITNGGVMIGRIVRMRSSPLCLNPVRVAISAKARPSAVQPAAHRNASMSVFHATPQRVLPAMQREAPDLLGEQALGKRDERKRAGAVLQRRNEDPEDREEGEHGHQRGNGDHAGGDERIALEVAAAREPQREQHAECRDDEPGAEPHAELSARQRRQRGRERLEVPAGRADDETLHEQQNEAGRPDGDQRIGACPARNPHGGNRRARGEQDAERGQPPLAVQQNLQQRRCRFLRCELPDPAEREHAVLQRVPRNEQEARRADGEPEDYRPARIGHRGA